MTNTTDKQDGIIQKVFDRYFDIINSPSYHFDIGDLRGLELEIIEKIKQINFNSWDEAILIGDNKE